MTRWNRAIGYLLVAVVFGTGLSSCGEAKIETPAADMNLTQADIGADFDLIAEEELAELGDRIDAELRENMVELNRRMFSGSDRVVWAWVVTYATAPTPPGAFVDLSISIEMSNRRRLVDAASDLCQQFGSAECSWTEPLGGVASSENVEGVEFGEATNFKVMGGPEDTVHAYVLVFRQANVVGVLEVVGLRETLEQSWIEDLGRALESKIK